MPRSRGQGRGAISVAHVCTIDVTARKLLLPQLLALRDEGFDVAVVCAPSPDVNELTHQGIRHVPWPSATRAWAPLSDLKAFTELLRIFRRERFDVVHTHNPKPGILGRIAARAAGVPHVINTVHGFYATPDDRVARRLPVMVAEW
ncbi:MAG: glycosyltransferase, partial [Chloroflexota bacterium]|nr:glycosyltransferase [Chloroflexota bacterium]